ncbi:uncharacterized protein LOC111235950 [Seriola dumerili]|uniref:uncharacterized protein LOC111235950 n=1 Tax=Seriola dumerili TaxID=41447 RepID=UPI000BBF2316|nr:uncharacterized protein LOC111235950 [Seriola dumerili]
MIGREIALEALGVLCNAKVTSVQQRSRDGTSFSADFGHAELFSIKQLIPAVLHADQTRQGSISIFQNALVAFGGGSAALANTVPAGLQSYFPLSQDVRENQTTKELELHIKINEEEFFDPGFDYDFTHLTDTQTYWRGGEKYERPCGFKRFALKVLGKYDDDTWLGTSYRSTESLEGEWPVSYHGTSEEGAKGIIEGHYKVGDVNAYGDGIYSTPDISVAKQYAKTFTSKNDKKSYKVILQNRINPEYRKEYNNDKYWLIRIPKEKSDEEQQKMVERAIRPYGLLLKKV